MKMWELSVPETIKVTPYTHAHRKSSLVKHVLMYNEKSQDLSSAYLVWLAAAAKLPQVLKKLEWEYVNMNYQEEDLSRSGLL